MKKIFKQIPTEIPKPTPEYFKKNRQPLLNDIGGSWYLNNMRNPKPPIKNQSLIHKQQEE